MGRCERFTYRSRLYYSIIVYKLDLPANLGEENTEILKQGGEKNEAVKK